MRKIIYVLSFLPSLCAILLFYVKYDYNSYILWLLFFSFFVISSIISLILFILYLVNKNINDKKKLIRLIYVPLSFVIVFSLTLINLNLTSYLADRHALIIANEIIKNENDKIDSLLQQRHWDVRNGNAIKKYRITSISYPIHLALDSKYDKFTVSVYHNVDERFVVYGSRIEKNIKAEKFVDDRILEVDITKYFLK